MTYWWLDKQSLVYLNGFVQFLPGTNFVGGAFETLVRFSQKLSSHDKPSALVERWWWQKFCLNKQILCYFGSALCRQKKNTENWKTKPESKLLVSTIRVAVGEKKCQWWHFDKPDTRLSTCYGVIGKAGAMSWKRKTIIKRCVPLVGVALETSL